MEAGGLPVELWGMALRLLDVSELYACLTVSKQFFRAAMDPQWWEARCRRDLALSSLPEGTISWTEAYKQHFWKWDANYCYAELTIEDRLIRSKGGCGTPKVVCTKNGFRSGWHRWGIQTPNGAGCHSAVGIMTKEYPLLGRIGLDFEHSWGMAMSPGPEKPKGPHRIEMPGRLDRDEVAVIELNLDEGWMRITVDGLERAYWNDLGIIKQNGWTVYPALNTCHSEIYLLLPPNDDLLHAPQIEPAEVIRKHRLRWWHSWEAVDKEFMEKHGLNPADFAGGN